jgi:hypothetical protein
LAGLAVVAIGVLSAIPQASASPARCLLQVDGRVYLQGRCNYEPLDGDSFAIGTAGDGLAASPYFAYAHRGTSYWNGTPPSSHAHDSLPGLYREGACMRNRTGSTRLCAWGL